MTRFSASNVKAFRRTFALAALLLGISFIGLASHNAGDPELSHPTWSGTALTIAGGNISPRIRDSTGAIRVLADAYAGDVDTAISRWNSAMGRTVFQRVTSGAWELRIRNRAPGECPNVGSYNAFYVNVLGETCGIGPPAGSNYEHYVPGYILLGSGFGGVTDKATAFTHEMGHDLGVEDHYYQQQTPGCRSDVTSIMENWGCSGTSPTSHDIDDVNKAYRISAYAYPWVNFISANDAFAATFNYDTWNDPARSVHNETATGGMRWRKKSFLEGTVVAFGTQDRPPTHSYSLPFDIENGERCFSANGRTNYALGEGDDGSEACIERLQFTPASFVVATSDTHNANDRDYFRLANFTSATITNAALYGSNIFIAWVTQPGQPAGRINNGQVGQAYDLDLGKGAYEIRFERLGFSHTITIGLDDCGLCFE